ncbi:hypothetical protein ACIP98_41120 [Streptomyces sp. NPDC088354]|uniref:hypothetical protein n=1 Tax=Streptomyces sp. NPDC088354 TaxID=3365856 RepID=UPI00382431BA
MERWVRSCIGGADVRASNYEVRRLRRDVRVLVGPDHRPSMRMCLALRRFIVSRRPALVGRLIAALVFSEILTILDFGVVDSLTETQFRDPQATGTPTVVPDDFNFLYGPLVLVFLALLVAMAAILATMVVGPVAAFVVVWRGSPSSPWQAGRWVTRNRLVFNVALTIRACAAASTASADKEPERLREVALRLTVTSRLIARAYRDSGTVRWPSHRRKALRLHGGQVVARLRAAERRLDTDSGTALRELAALLLCVCDRYVHGRVGALLDEEELAGLEPVKDWDWVRVVMALLAGTGAAVGASFLPVPDAGQPYAIAGVAASAFVLAYTDQPGKAFELWSKVAKPGG